MFLLHIIQAVNYSVWPEDVIDDVALTQTWCTVGDNW